MAFPIVATVSPRQVLFTTADGRTHTIPGAHPRFTALAALVRLADVARREGDQAAAAALTGMLPRLAGVAAMPPRAEVQTHGPVQVRDGGVRVDDEPMIGPLAERVLWSLREGLDIRPLTAFLANLIENPSKRPVEDLFDFVDSRGLAITEDGHLIGYERVRADFRDTRGGATDNSPGRLVEVRRNRVEEDPSRPCAVSLRFGPFPHYEITSGLGEDRIVAVKVNPRDVVAVPTVGLDGVRCCRYEVLFECVAGQGGTARHGPAPREDEAAAAPAPAVAAAVPAGVAAAEPPAPELEPLALTADMMIPSTSSAAPVGAVGVASVAALKEAAANIAGSGLAEEAVRGDGFVFGPDRARSGAAEDRPAPLSEPAEAVMRMRRRLPWPLTDAPAGVMGA
jgi:hypothetical protein